MALWTAFVEFLEAGLFATTQLCGGNMGWGIVVVSLALRFGLLPLTYRAARDSQKRALIMRKLQPQLDRLRKRYQKDPMRIAEENARLMRNHGLPLVDRSTLVGGAVQLPFALGMFSVIRRVLGANVGGRFFWIRDIARPDPLLALLVAGTVAVSALLAPQISDHVIRWQVVVPVLLTLIFLLQVSSGLGLYWGASSVVGGLQAVLVRRDLKTSSRLRSVN